MPWVSPKAKRRRRVRGGEVVQAPLSRPEALALARALSKELEAAQTRLRALNEDRKANDPAFEGVVRPDGQTRYCPRCILCNRARPLVGKVYCEAGGTSNLPHVFPIKGVVHTKCRDFVQAEHERRFNAKGEK